MPVSYKQMSYKTGFVPVWPLHLSLIVRMQGVTYIFELLKMQWAITDSMTFSSHKHLVQNRTCISILSFMCVMWSNLVSGGFPFSCWTEIFFFLTSKGHIDLHKRINNPIKNIGKSHLKYCSLAALIQVKGIWSSAINNGFRLNGTNGLPHLCPWDAGTFHFWIHPMAVDNHLATSHEAFMLKCWWNGIKHTVMLK